MRGGLSKCYCDRLRKVIVHNLVNEGAIKFYACYVDDKMLLLKRQDIYRVLKAFNGSTKILSLPLINLRKNSTFLRFRNMPQ